MFLFSIQINYVGLIVGPNGFAVFVIHNYLGYSFPNVYGDSPNRDPAPPVPHCPLPSTATLLSVPLGRSNGGRLFICITQDGGLLMALTCRRDSIRSCVFAGDFTWTEQILVVLTHWEEYRSTLGIWLPFQVGNHELWGRSGGPVKGRCRHNGVL